MKARLLFVLALAVSLVIHAGVLLLVSFEVTEMMSAEPVKVAVRRVILPKPTPPPVTRPEPPGTAPQPTAPVEAKQAQPVQEVPAIEEPVPEPEVNRQLVGEPAGKAASSSKPESRRAIGESADNPAGDSRIATEQPDLSLPGEEISAERIRILNALRSMILEGIVYPPLARRRGLEGRVVLRLAINTAGEADALFVTESSGHAILDRAALQLVSCLLPLKRGPSQPLTVEIPITYRLTR